MIARILSHLPGRRMSDVFAAVPGNYDQDGLRSIHNHDFMQDAQFIAAYRRGVAAAGSDYGWHWRVHVGLWAAATAASLPGDFVECGVNRGFLSSAIMQFLDWDKLNKRFYLLDTFSGLDPKYVSKEELDDGVLDKGQAAIDSGFYVIGVDSVRANFSEWRNVKIIEGSIPTTLPEVDSNQVAFMHIDMNCSPPEIAALSYLWGRLVPGAIVLLDDYAYYGYEHQKRAMDRFAKDHGVMIASLPTGQGLLIRT
jgi:hypothetical protein